MIQYKSINTQIVGGQSCSLMKQSFVFCCHHEDDMTLYTNIIFVSLVFKNTLHNSTHCHPRDHTNKQKSVIFLLKELKVPEMKENQNIQCHVAGLDKMATNSEGLTVGPSSPNSANSNSETDDNAHVVRSTVQWQEYL